MTNQPLPQSRVPGLDLVRAIAISVVVYSHITVLNEAHSLTINPMFDGYLGVELFFVLSGFLIGGIIFRSIGANRFQSFDDLLFFWRRRWYRTLPNYFLFLCIFYYFERPDSFTTVLSYASFTQNLLWRPLPFFSLSWSLSAEEWFYLFFPAALLILSLVLKSRDRAFYGTFFAILALGIFLASLIPFQTSKEGFQIFRQGALIRLPSIMMGVLVAYLKWKSSWIWTALKSKAFLLLAPVLLLIASNFRSVFHTNLVFEYRWAQIAFFPTLSLCFASVLPIADSIKSIPFRLVTPIEHISKISYSLYLCHIPVIFTLDRWILKMLPEVFSANMLLLIGLYLGLSLVTAHLFWKFWETPWLELRDRR